MLVFPWSLSDITSSQISKTRLSILVDVNNAVIWMFFSLPLPFDCSNPVSNRWGNVSSTPITLAMAITLMFHSFFNSLLRSKYFFMFLLSFIFTVWFAGTAKSTTQPLLFFCLFYLVWLSGWDKVIRLCIHHLIVWSKFSPLHNFQWIIFFTQSWLVLYASCDNLQHYHVNPFIYSPV